MRVVTASKGGRADRARQSLPEMECARQPSHAAWRRPWRGLTIVLVAIEEIADSILVTITHSATMRESHATSGRLEAELTDRVAPLRGCLTTITSRWSPCSISGVSTIVAGPRDLRRAPGGSLTEGHERQLRDLASAIGCLRRRGCALKHAVDDTAPTTASSWSTRSTGTRRG